METYCGNNCTECASKEALNCPGCAAGPGKKYQPTCKLAMCCRDKGHERCDTCSFAERCAIYRRRAHMAEDRLREQAAHETMLAETARRAPAMRRWLLVLFCLFILANIASVLNELFATDWIPAVALPGAVATMACNLLYAVALFMLRDHSSHYRTAAVLAALASVASGTNGILAAACVPLNGVDILLTLPAAAASAVSLYHECKAHEESMSYFDDELSVNWGNHWKWRLGSVAAIFASALVMALFKVLGFLMLIVSLIAVLILAIMKPVYLYRSASECRIFAEHYQMTKGK